MGEVNFWKGQQMKRIYLVAAIAAAVTLPSMVYASMDKKEGHRFNVEQMFEKHDANKDGKLTKDEMPERASKMFDRVDQDKDGAITKAEAEAAKEKFKKKRHERHGKFQAKMMEKFDTNKDGKVSQAEFTDFTMKKFAEIDADGDGNVTKEELKKHRDSKGFGGWRGKHRG